MERYRNLSRLRGIRSDKAAEEHAEICDSALKRDATRAAEIATNHFRATGEIIASGDTSMLKDE